MLFSKIITKLLSVLHISRAPVVRVYDGYGDADNIFVQGHVLRIGPRPRKKYRENVWVNFFSLIRMFIVSPQKQARLRMEFAGETLETVSANDGSFSFDWKPVRIPEPGWHVAKVSYLSNHAVPQVLAQGMGEVFIPHSYQYSFISDIDDTFLVSHSRNIFKRLLVLFTKNARTRKPFDDVVEHYRMLSAAGATGGLPNPFFYVSSSEWNLYDYVKEFCRKEKLPRGVFLLSRMKTFGGIFKTGQGRHSEKYIRIARILNSFPDHKYVLLGDNGQEDPGIYLRVVRDFPGKIHAVYIRLINKKRKGSALQQLEEIRKLGVEIYAFRHSGKAMEHTRKIGLG